MEKKNQIPKYPLLRFLEFTDEWKEVKLGEVAEILMCKRILASQTNTISGVPFFKIGTIGKTPDCYITRELFNEYKLRYSYPQKGQVLLTCSGTIGRCWIFSGEDAYFQDSNIVWIDNPENVLLNRYLYYILIKTDWSKLNSSTITRLYNDDLRRLNLRLPSLAEQRKIAALLSLIDERIEVQNAIIKEQEALKASLLRRLFDRTLCFPEFTDEWKEVRLGEVTCERNETNAPTLPLLSITANKGVIPQTDSEKKDVSNADKSKYKRICSGDIGYNTMRMWQGRSALSFVEGIVSPAYTIVTPLEGVSPLFLSYLIKRPRLIYEFWTHSQGLVEDTLNCKYKDFAQITITIPSLPEQRKIAALLSAIDERITVEKEYATLLQKQKAYLLRQMFV